MSDADTVPAPGEALLTPLSAAVRSQAIDLRSFCGVRTPNSFDTVCSEIDALLSSAAVSDLGWRGKIMVTGGDRLRWLNGMVTNSVQGLPENEGNYSFLLNAQGRIQGDCYIYRRADALILDTSSDQTPALLRHLDHYIIMDEVELAVVSGEWTSLALVGPNAPQILALIGFVIPPAPSLNQNARMLEGNKNARIFPGRIGGSNALLIEAASVLVPRYELWFHPAEVLAVWQALHRAGASSAGLEAMETLRVVEGTPLYGVDLNDRDLPQETGQTRALNFTKGCYLGQEIVERIRSRGKVHRQLHQFTVEGRIPGLPFELRSGDQAVGRITSAVSVSSIHLSGSFALGIAREEVIASKSPIQFEGGTVTPLDSPPQIITG